MTKKPTARDVVELLQPKNRKGREAKVSALLDAAPELIKVFDKEQALWRGAHFGLWPLFELLLERGANPNPPPTLPLEPIPELVMALPPKESKRLLQLWLKKGGRFDHPEGYPSVLDKAAQWDDVAKLKQLLKLEPPRPVCVEALNQALLTGSAKAAALLLEEVGASEVGTSGLTPLHAAALSRDVALLDKVLARTRDVQIRLERPATFLAHGAEAESGEVPELELPAGTTALDANRRLREFIERRTAKKLAAELKKFGPDCFTVKTIRARLAGLDATYARLLAVVKSGVEALLEA